jgi:hypothetical protein
MATRATSIIDKYHGWIEERLKAFKDHVAEGKDIANRIVDPAADPPRSTMRALVGDIIGLGISCYDIAVGWMVPPK